MRRPRAHAPALVGLLGTALGLAWSWQPSYWYDEAATLSAATRGTEDLMGLVGRLDLVHGIYYLAMKPWIAVTGTSEFATRSFSALGLGLTCAGVVMVGRRLAGEGFGVAAGVASALMPGLAWTGSEARVFAWACACVVFWVLAALRALDHGRVRDWLVYTAALMLSVHLFLISILMVPVLVVAGWRRDRRADLLASSLVGTLLCAPFVGVAKGQDQALGDTGQSPVMILAKIAGRQYFLSPRGPREPGWAWVWAIVLALACVMLAWRALTADDSRAKRRLLTLVLPWILLPTLVLLLWSWTVRPIYAERYLVFTAPALALLLTYGFLDLRDHRRRQIALGVVVVVACAVIQTSQREEGSKAQDHYRALAVFVAERQPDAVIFAVPSTRGIAVAYPEAFVGIEAPNVGLSATESDTLWGTVQLPRSLRLRDVVPPGGRLVLLDVTDPRWPGTPFQRWLVRHRCEVEEQSMAERFTATLVRCP